MVIKLRTAKKQLEAKDNVNKARQNAKKQVEALRDFEAAGKIESLKDEFGIFFEAWLNQARSEIANTEYGNDEDQKKDIIRIESKAITKFYNELSNFRDFISDKYKGQLFIKGQWYPRKWMLNDVEISKLLNRYKIVQILNALEKHLFSPDNQQYDLENPKGYQLSYAYACFVTNTEFYKRIMPEVGLSKIAIQKYLAALHNVGALVKLRKTGQDVQRNETLYALGYYSEYRRNPKLNRFLTDHQKMDLRKFAL